MGFFCDSFKFAPPDEANGVLTGYEISYESMTQQGVGERVQCPSITNPKQTIAKLTSLKPSTNYRIYIKATTKAGASEPYVNNLCRYFILYLKYLNHFFLSIDFLLNSKPNLLYQ
jgi:hypothetical protein